MTIQKKISIPSPPNFVLLRFYVVFSGIISLIAFFWPIDVALSFSGRIASNGPTSTINSSSDALLEYIAPLNKKLKKTGKLWVCVFPDIPRSQKPAEVRMGKGKGAIAFWTSQVEAGQILFELTTNSPDIALQASKTISRMASIPVCLIKKEQPL